MAENDQNNGQAAAAADEQNNQPQFALQRIYTKDLSFESPRAPAAFQEKWAPQVQMDINTGASKVKEDLYEVVLSLTLTVKNQDETAYLVEVQQAGICLIKGMEKEGLERTLGSFCPNLLFPYAREAVDNLVTRGSFPPLHLAPVNFDAIYAEALKRRAEQGEGSDQEAQTTH